MCLIRSQAPISLGCKIAREQRPGFGHAELDATGVMCCRVVEKGLVGRLKNQENPELYRRQIAAIMIGVSKDQLRNSGKGKTGMIRRLHREQPQGGRRKENAGLDQG